MLSTNYLPSLILSTANLPLTTYQQYLYNLYQDYPVITLYGCYDSDGNYYDSIYDIDSELYQSLQYNNVIDRNRIDNLFHIKSEN